MRRTGVWLTGVVAVLVGFGSVAPTRAAAVVDIGWTLAPRLADVDGDGAIDVPAIDAARPAAWSVTLDACGTSGSTWRWTVGSPPAVTTSTCTLATTVTGATTVRVVVDGTSRGSVRVTPADHLVALLGDSYASGEGAPDRPATRRSDAVWVDESCHRSGRAGGALAAAALDAADPHSTVRFVDTACSGATIDAGLLGSQGGREPQIEPLRRALADHRGRVAVIVGIGGNDVGFGDLLEACLTSRCDTPELTAQVDERLAALGARLADLRACLTTTDAGACDGQPGLGLPARAVVATLYPDLTTAAVGGGRVQPCRYLSVTSEEFIWAKTEVIDPLDDVIARAWRASSVVDPRPLTEGHCMRSPQRWFGAAADSVATQGDVGGSFHPNAVGHREGYAPLLTEALVRLLPSSDVKASHSSA